MFKLEPVEKVGKEILENLGLCGVELIGNLRLNHTYWNIIGTPSVDIEGNIRQVNSLSKYIYI